MSEFGVLHVSDFHFGGRLDPWIYFNAPLVKYRNPHSLELAAGLQEAILSIPENHDIPVEAIKIIMSGDVTATGSEHEFCVAHTYVQAGFRFTCPASSDLGLGCDVHHSTLLKVPGNHDQWCGTHFPGKCGYNTQLSGTHFVPTPWHDIWDYDGSRVHFFGIDSCSGLSTNAPTWNQEAALDLSVGGEVDRLEDELRHVQQNDPADHLNVLVLHHSLASTGFDLPSKHRLLDLVETYAIRIVLTGHTHDSFTQQLDSIHAHGKKLESFEIRAPSALQGPPSRTWPEAPGFLLHTVRPIHGYSGGTEFEWNAYRYQWDVPTACFELFDKSSPSSFFRNLLKCS